MLSGIDTLRKYTELEGKTFLVCVGGMRCATSWLYYYLQALPEVAVSPLKELHFFNTKFPQNALYDMNDFAMRRLLFHATRDGIATVNLMDRPTFQASVDRVQMIYDDNAYGGHFARLCTAETRTLCDITPAYAVIGRDGFDYMKKFLARQGVLLKLVFIMRDPVDRLWSQLKHMQHMEPAASYVAGWEEAIQSPPICARADYKGTVADLDTVFPPDDVLYLFYETLFSEASLRRLCRFAGVDVQPGRVDEVRNEARVEADLPDEARLKFHDLLAPQYVFCRDRFAESVPQSWAV